MTDDPDGSLARRLRQLGAQLLAMANEISPARGGDAALAAVEGFRGPKRGEDAGDIRLTLAEQMYRQRRRRADVMPFDIFGEPAWDLLLDLYIAERRDIPVSITSACIGAQVPETTALRWIQRLEKLGLVERQRDSDDKRRQFLRLTRGGYTRMNDYFAACTAVARMAGTFLSGERADLANYVFDQPQGSSEDNSPLTRQDADLRQ